MKIYNMTQHKLQTTQVAQAEQLGYKFVESSRLDEVKKVLSNLGGTEDLAHISKELILACAYEKIEALVFPIGSPLFYFEFAKIYNGFSGERFPVLLFSHTKREAVETPQADGSIVKTMLFNHVGFHEVKPNCAPTYHAKGV